MKTPSATNFLVFSSARYVFPAAERAIHAEATWATIPDRRSGLTA